MSLFPIFNWLHKSYWNTTRVRSERGSSVWPVTQSSGSSQKNGTFNVVSTTGYIYFMKSCWSNFPGTQWHLYIYMFEFAEYVFKNYENSTKSLKYIENTLKIMLIGRCSEGWLWRCAIIGANEGLWKVSGIVFCCH